MRRLSRRTLLAWAGLGAVVPACISPTLPLPPPSVPDATDLGNGTYRLVGTLPIYATVLVKNQRTDVIVGKGPLTAYDLVVAAEGSDTIVLWYETDLGDVSSPVAFEMDRLTPDFGNPGPDAGP
ncbi:MAG TPA: hypothetical protein VH062_27205 [Polyangiaceae bacterium]|jgi:hypothetical protein|nr:hypothetical protein [Polyangiaceae bacterium]